MAWFRSRQRAARPHNTIRKDVALRFLLATILAWLGIQSITHLATLDRGLRDAGLGRAAATALAVVWSVGALAAAGALAGRSTARAGASGAVVLAVAILTLSVFTWIRGTPVPCSCATPTLQHGARHHGEAVVGDALLLGLAVITFVAARARSVRVPPPA